MLLDVMVPAYGDGGLLRETVHSVLAQTDPGWRLTIVDDGLAAGLDGELEGWLLGLGDVRVRYLGNPVRLGINRNFQRCVQQSQAELVMILGADDRLLPHYVGVVRQEMARVPDAAWVHPGVTVIDGRGQPVLPMADRVKRLTAPKVHGQALLGGEPLAASLLRGNWMYFPAVTFRGEVLRRHGFRPGHDIVLDLDLYLRILLAGGQALLLQRPCAEYRRHSASLSSTDAGTGSRFREESTYFAEISATMTAAGWPRAARAARLHWTSRLHTLLRGYAALTRGDARSAAAMARIALAATPRPAPGERSYRREAA